MPSTSAPGSEGARRSTVLFHAALPDDWHTALATGTYTTSTRGVTLTEQGFVHCAYRHQLDGVVARFYADVAELVLLTIDPARLDVPVRAEPAADGIDELFPHVYGPIPVDAVVRDERWRPGRDRLGPDAR